MGYDRLNTRVYSLGMKRCKLAAFLLFSFFWVQKIARRNGITNSRVEKKKKKKKTERNDWDKIDNAIESKNLLGRIEIGRE